MISLTGFHVIEVEPGTVIGQDELGRDVVVTETAAVSWGSRMYVTPRQYAALKREAPPRA